MANLRKTDANPEVKGADALEADTTKDLAGRSEFEKATGVPEEQLDTRVVVDTSKETKTFDERTSNVAPWQTYQDGIVKMQGERDKENQKDLAKEAKEADKK